MRRLSNIVTASCLAVIAALLVLYVRSYWASDELTLARDHGGAERVRFYRGYLVVRHIDPEVGRPADPTRPRVSHRVHPIDLPWSVGWACGFRTYGKPNKWGPVWLAVVHPADVQTARANVLAAELSRDLQLQRVDADLARAEAASRARQVQWAQPAANAQQRIEVDGGMAQVERLRGQHELRVAEHRRDMAVSTAEHVRATEADGASPRWQLIVPMWVPVALVSFPPALRLAVRWRRRHRASRRLANGLCVACGYDLRRLSGDRCPECGAPAPRPARHGLDVPLAAWVHP